MAKRKDCVKKCRACKGNIVKDKAHILNDNELLIEEFRLARSKWIASKKGSKTINEKSEAGPKESARQKFRHFKTVRPLPYFTLKSELSYTKLLKLEEKEKRKKEKICTRKLIQDIENEEFFKEHLKLMKENEKIQKEVQKEEISVIKEERKEKKTKGPSKKAIENLKAAKLADGVVESLKFNDGKEVTVVIKGFCLCDKDNVRKFKLDKIREDYQKLEQSRQQAEESGIKSHLTDSLVIHKKRQSVHKINEDEYDPPVTNTKSGKRVLFEPNEKIEKKNQKKPCVVHKDKHLKRELDEVEKKKKMELQNAEKKAVEKRSENEGREKEMKTIKNEIKEIEKKPDNQNKNEKEKHERKKYEVPNIKEKPLEENLPPSLITLFKNRSPDLSEWGLTEEQSTKIKNIQHRKK